MRLFWIVVGILALCWLGFLHFSHNQIRLDLDRTNTRLDNHEQQNGVINNNGNSVQQETKDKAIDTKQNVKQKVAPQKQNLDQNLNQNLNKNNQPIRKEVPSVAPKKDATKKDVETSLPYTSGFAQESIVAFNYGNDQSEVAFKQLETPTLGDMESKEAYLIIDPMLLSLK